VVAALEAEMAKAAEALDFERAAALRDMAAGLAKTVQPARRFARRGPGGLGPSVRPGDDVRELGEALGLGAPPEVMECFDISNISTTHVVASMVRFRGGVPDRAGYRRYRVRTVRGQDDFASMAEVVRRRYARVLAEARREAGDEAADFNQEGPLEALRRMEAAGTGARPGPGGRRAAGAVRLPDLVVVDGGKGQLGAAVYELQRLGLGELPVIGLAKEREEVFRPGVAAPLVLDRDSGALKLLQRIRDEAHRFANSYHQLLMKRRVEESILDDCPGVSSRRKQALLRRFGSVARMRKASADDLAAAPGISPALAREIEAFLRSRSPGE
jgi:excinuclease ABC subunit C